MIMSAVAIVSTLGVALLWMTRGFFSALIHMVCVLIAGAIAFAAWEPLAYVLLDQGSGFLQDSAWALALALPFGISVAVLRVAVDSLVRANVKVAPAAEYIGGGVCGAVAGVVTAGILVLSLGFLRAEDEFLGYKAADWASQGSVQRQSGLIVPVDKIVTKAYSRFSQSSLRTASNLGDLYPDLEIVPTTLRLNYGNGKARNTIRPADFDAKGRYTVGEGKNLKPADLLVDRWGTAAQNAVDLDGKTYPAGSYLDGYVIQFSAGARERAEPKVAFGNSQVRLVVQNADGEVKTLFPVAAVLQADGTKPVLGRYRFDSKAVFFASAGAAANVGFGIEFLVPPGFTGKALYVKNARVMVEDGPLAQAKVKFDSPMDRDMGLGQVARMLGMPEIGIAPVAGSSGTSTTSSASTKGTPDEYGFRSSNSLVFIIHKTTVRTLTVQEEGNIISDGEQTFSKQELAQPPIERQLQVRGLLNTSDTVIVQLNVSLGQKSSWLGQAAASVEDILPPALVDTNGQRYQPIGYVYKNSQDGNTTVRFTPSNPVRALKEVPTLSRSRPNDELTLIFQVTLGVTVQNFSIGEKTVVVYNPPIKLDQAQARPR